jgi:CRP-like cAMP-binding protein
VFEKADQVLGILKYLDFLGDLSVQKVQEFIGIVTEEHFQKGDYLIRKGTVGNNFFIIYSGIVSLKDEGLEVKKTYSTYDYFGELSLITQQERFADIVAETDVIAYSISKDKFLSFISGTEFEGILHRLARVRSSETWNVLSRSRFFNPCTSFQKTMLESMFEPVELKNSGSLGIEGEELKDVFIIRNGEVHVYKDQKLLGALGIGDLIGCVQCLFNNKPEQYTYTYTNDVSLFKIKRSDINAFLSRNPGMIMKLRYQFA